MSKTNLARIWWLFDEYGLKGDGSWVTREDVTVISHNLQGNRALDIEVLVGQGDDMQWVPLIRNGNPVQISALNTQYFEVHPGTYRIAPASAATLVPGQDRLFFREVKNPEALLLAIAHDISTASTPAVLDGQNVGGGQQVFKARSGTDLVFRTVSAQAPAEVTTNGDLVEVSVLAADTTRLGVAERATEAETLAGTDDERFITPRSLKVALDENRWMKDPLVP